MIYSTGIQKAIKFSIKTHEIYQQQKRKGKKVPYIVHPLSVGLILAKIGASEDIIIAGILHDTIEDSIAEKKVTKAMLTERFGENVAFLVESVTEKRKDLSWEERKKEALKHVESFSNDSLLLKSADIINNETELLADYEKEGNQTFSRFNAPKEKLIDYKLRLISAVVQRWPDNPLKDDLLNISSQLQHIEVIRYGINYPASQIEYIDYNENMPLVCPVCDWKGTPKESGDIEYYKDLMDVSCPICEKMLLIISYPEIPKGK
jgi:hypothetical protein